MPSIDLNCDLGESFGAYTIGMDAEILPYVTSAQIGDSALWENNRSPKIGKRRIQRQHCPIGKQGR